MVGWEPSLGPWKPVRRGDKLYGRGGADDGYAAYASLTALRLLQEQGKRRSRCVVIIEGCEEGDAVGTVNCEFPTCQNYHMIAI